MHSLCNNLSSSPLITLFASYFIFPLSLPLVSAHLPAHKQTQTSCVHTDSHLHPEEQSLGASFKLQHVDTSGGALVNPLEFTVIREDDQILEQGRHNVRHSRETGTTVRSL